MLHTKPDTGGCSQILAFYYTGFAPDLRGDRHLPFFPQSNSFLIYTKFNSQKGQAIGWKDRGLEGCFTCSWKRPLICLRGWKDYSWFSRVQLSSPREMCVLGLGTKFQPMIESIPTINHSFDFVLCMAPDSPENRGSGISGNWHLELPSNNITPSFKPSYKTDG